MLRILVLATGILTVVLLAGCASGSKNAPAFANPPMPTNTTFIPASSPEVILVTETAVPTDTAIPPVGTPTSIPIIASNGLGARKDVWERINGTPTTVNAVYQGAESAVYGAGLQVTFDARAVVVSIGKDYKSKGMVSLTEAKAESLKLIPSDAVPARHFDHPSIDPNSGQSTEPLVLVDIYVSKSLTTIFPPDVWPNVPGYIEDPGTFYVQYEQYPSKGNKVGAFLMELSTPP